MTQIAMLTTEETAALLAWRFHTGRGWRRELRKAWETGDYQRFGQADVLQRLRNNRGLYWLASFKPTTFGP